MHWSSRRSAIRTAGRLSVLRIFSGKLDPDSTVYSSAKDAKERFGQLLRLKGKTQDPIQTSGPGDIVAVAKLKETTTQDTLCSEKDPILFPPIEMPPAVYSLAVEPKSKGDEEKIFSSLSRLMEEDLTLKLERNEATREMILSGMGEIHIEATVEKLKRKFGVEVNLRLPKVSYKETIKGKARVQGRYKKQSGGRGQYGDCWIEMEPLPKGEGFQFEDRIVGGVIPRQYIPAVEKGIVDACLEGALAGILQWTSKLALWMDLSIPWTHRKWPSRSQAPWLSRKLSWKPNQPCWNPL